MIHVRCCHCLPLDPTQSALPIPGPWLAPSLGLYPPMNAILCAHAAGWRIQEPLRRDRHTVRCLRRIATVQHLQNKALYYSSCDRGTTKRAPVVAAA